MESDGVSIIVINIIIGAVLLLIGRNFFWLFVGCIGFAVGLQYAPLLWDVKSPAVLIVLSIVLAGFGGGAYITINLFKFTGLEWDTLFWVPYILGGIIGAIILFMVFDWALIFVSSFAGAMLIVQTLDLNPHANVWLLCVFFVLGVVFQTVRFLRARSAGQD
jgi:hypothetical protein